MKSSAEQSNQIECPRCGYDLRGMIATWDQECPLEGRCSECGLHLDWSQVFNQPHLTWLFEHQWQRRPIRSFFATLWYLQRPWSFWSRINLFANLRAVPLVILVTAVLLPLLVLRGYMQIQEWPRYQVSWSNTSPPPIDWPLMFRTWWRDYATSGPLTNALAWLIAMPTVYLLIPATLTNARVRKAHLLRIALYTTAWLLPYVLIIEYIDWKHRWGLHALRDVLDVIARPIGMGVVWMMRGFLRIPGFSIHEAESIGFTLLWGAPVAAVWYCACRSYMRLQRPEVTTLLLTTVAVLLVIFLAMARAQWL